MKAVPGFDDKISIASVNDVIHISEGRNACYGAKDFLKAFNH